MSTSDLGVGEHVSHFPTLDMMMMGDSWLGAEVREELSDGAYSTRGADTPAMDLISQIEPHCAGHREKNIDQDSFIPAGIW